MEIRRGGAALVAAALVGFVGAARADDAADAAERARLRRAKLAEQFDAHGRWAVLVAVDVGDDPHLSPLRFCVADAKLMARTLVDRCAYPPENVLVLGDGEPADRLPTRENILRHLLATLKRIRPGDTVLVYFSCHGANHNGQPLIACKDFDGASPGLTGVRIDAIRGMLHDSAAGQKMLVLDCCHSGAAKGGTGLLGITGDDLEGVKGPGGLITWAACRAQQQSAEDGAKAHGVFTYALARALGGEADENDDGIVDSDEAFAFTAFETEQRAREIGQAQTPVRIMGEDVVGVFALARVKVAPGATPGRAPVVDETKPGRRILNSIGMPFSVVMPGIYDIGSPANEVGREKDEPVFQVAIRRPFFLGATEVTQAQYAKVMGTNPSHFRAGGEGEAATGGADTGEWPVENVTWEEAVEFCRRLTALPAERAERARYRLPTEAEWEYACRAGTTTAFHTGETIGSDAANVDGTKPYLDEPGTALKRPTKVASYPPNAWNLHDMHGNVWEWVADWYDPTRGSKDVYGGLVEKPTQDSLPGGMVDGLKGLEGVAEGPATGTTRVMRGGSYSGKVALARSASRRDRAPEFRDRTVGFRVVAVPDEFPVHERR